MTISAPNGLIWPRPDELREIAAKRTLTSDELLALKSRSFYFPIQLLEVSRGRNESNKKPIITTLYNILRELDTVEDANPKILKPGAKVTAIDHFARLMNDLTRRSPSEPIEDLKSDLVLFTETIPKEAISEDEKIFMEHFGRGEALEYIKANPTQAVKEAIGYCVHSMSSGMKAFLKSSKITTKKELIEYCGYVASDVGTALNRIIERMDGVKLSDDSARAFGLSLQLTNIIKNIHEDWKERGVTYIPEEFYAGITNKTLFNLDSEPGRTARKSVLEKMVGEAKKDMMTSIEYVKSAATNELSGYAGFSMVALFTAIETLRAVEKANADEVFAGKDEATKLSPESFKNITRFSYGISSYGVKKIEDFLENYKIAQANENYEAFSFLPDRFDIWTKDLLKSS